MAKDYYINVRLDEKTYRQLGEYERTCADLGTGPAWVTPESLIESFGDQAYHKAMRMFVEMISFTPDDFENINVLRDACYELMQRGYHKKPQNLKDIPVITDGPRT